MKKQICSICKKEYTGYGNNAWPINEDRCCDKCNEEVVIPQRIIYSIIGGEKYEKANKRI